MPQRTLQSVENTKLSKNQPTFIQSTTLESRWKSVTNMLWLDSHITKMFCVTLFKMPTTLRRQNFLFLKITSKSISEYIWRKQHNGQVLKILFMVCFCHSYDVLCHSSVISLITNYSREYDWFAAISIRRVYYV